MKNVLPLGALLLVQWCGISGNAQAAETILTEVQRKTVTIPLNIVPSSFRVTNTYPAVKVLLPELAAMTLLNHREDDDEAPSLLSKASRIQDIVQNKPATETVTVTIVLRKAAWIDEAEQICHLSLEESADMQIRGVKFRNFSSTELPDRNVADCR